MRITFIFLFILLASCSSFSDAGKALRNEKTKTTDEFLIEKRGPLSIPPDMEKLPKPKSNKNNELSNKDLFKKNTTSENSEEKSRLENILLEEIKKN